MPRARRHPSPRPRRSRPNRSRAAPPPSRGPCRWMRRRGSRALFRVSWGILSLNRLAREDITRRRRAEAVRRGGPSCAPGIVGAEVPDVTLGVAARIPPAAIVLGLDVHDDLRAGRFGTGEMGIGILDDE